MDLIDKLENRSIHLLREARWKFPKLAMLWSMGKDSTVLLALARKAFLGKLPFPLIHIDTTFKMPEMIAFRNRTVLESGDTLLIGRNDKALAAGETFPSGTIDRVACCGLLKTAALEGMVQGTSPRLVLDPQTGKLLPWKDTAPFDSLILGIRADEEGTRSKERYFSPRSSDNRWKVENQPPEIWDQFRTDFPAGTHVRVHPLLDWTESDIWRYIEREKIEVVPLYFDQGAGKRYRSLGCQPCTQPIESTAKTAAEVLAELSHGKLSRVAERAGRAQDQEDSGGLEKLRRKGYM